MRIFSGIQPTGIPHLGNYLGALKEWVKLQYYSRSAEIILYSIVDYHSITTKNNPTLLRRSTEEMAMCLLACRIDPTKAVVFQQSKVPEHCELSWILSCLTSTAQLRRMHHWKSKSGKESEHSSLGLFSYPVLMAADVLLYKSTHVPVGDDQMQHLELTRDLAKSINSRFAASLPIPDPILNTASRIKSLRNPLVKMSKSDTDPMSKIELTDSKDEVYKKIMKAVTDSEPILAYDEIRRPGLSNLINIYSTLKENSLEQTILELQLFKDKKDFKEALTVLINKELEGFQESYNSVKDDKDYVRKVLNEGAEKARCIAINNINEIKLAIGLS